VDFDNLYNLTPDTVENGPIELEYDFRQIQLKELLERIDHSLITEIWEDDVVDTLVINELFVRAKSNDHEDSTSNALSIPFFSIVAKSWSAMPIEPPEQAAAKVISRKQSAKRTLLGLARKCMESVDYDNPDNPDDLIKMFKECIYKHEEIQQYDQVTEDNQLIGGGQVGKHAQASCLE
ncbi:17633_t:CDS:2, partial [Racocetra persica]